MQWISGEVIKNEAHLFGGTNRLGPQHIMVLAHCYRLTPLESMGLTQIMTLACDARYNVGLPIKIMFDSLTSYGSKHLKIYDNMAMSCVGETLRALSHSKTNSPL